MRSGTGPRRNTVKKYFRGMDLSTFAVWFGEYPSVLPATLTPEQFGVFRRFHRRYPTAKLRRHRGVITGYCVDPIRGPISVELPD